MTTRLGGGREMLTTQEVLARYADDGGMGVFTDGSAIPNPGPGGWGFVRVVDGEIIQQGHGHEPDTTNNRMELTALIEAMKRTEPLEPVNLYSDSQLAVKTLTEWAPGWRRHGWRKSTRGPIKNLDLVTQGLALYEERPHCFVHWVRGHNGNLWNEYADSLSTAWLRSTV